jgi:hypothetical protein
VCRTSALQAQATQPVFVTVGWQPDDLQAGRPVCGISSRKAARTCNSLFLAEDTGLLLACSRPVAGNHHDLFEIEEVVGELVGMLAEAGICFSMLMQALTQSSSEGYIRV